MEIKAMNCFFLKDITKLLLTLIHNSYVNLHKTQIISNQVKIQSCWEPLILTLFKAKFSGEEDNFRTLA